MRISKQDNGELGKILRQFDKSLYKIQTYRKGRLVRTEGTLPDTELREGLASEVAAQARAMSYTGFALQAGKGTSSTHPTGGSTTNQTASYGGSTTNQKNVVARGSTTKPRDVCEKSRELVERLAPILSKYQKK
jgi:hypothetical protein